MKMTSATDSTAKKEARDRDRSPHKANNGSNNFVQAAGRSKIKNRLTFSIDSLVGKSPKPDAEPGQNESTDTGMDTYSVESKNIHADRSPSSVSPTSKHQLSNQPSPHQLQQTHSKAFLLPNTPPANGPDSCLSDQQHHRVIRHSAFMPPPVSSGPSVSGFAAPVGLAGGRICWDMSNGEPTVWKDAVTASAMYQAAAAFYAGYPWYGPPAPMAPNDMGKKRHLLLQHEQTQVNLLTNPSSPISHAQQHRHFVGQHGANSAMPTAPDQQQTFWHHHIAELLRQNGGHPIHPSRLYAGPEAGHAAASFLFSGCRKPKRIRTAFSPNQLMELETAFEKNQYVVGNERKDLARRLALTETQVKVWFQNRRTKAKRIKSEDGPGTPGAASSASSTTSANTVTKMTTAAPSCEQFQATKCQDVSTSDFDGADHSGHTSTLENAMAGTGSTESEPTGRRSEPVEAMIGGEEGGENEDEMDYNTSGEESN